MRAGIAVLILCVAAATASAVAAAQSAPSVGIRLVEPAGGPPADPRERIYIVDHVRPGARITREVEVVNEADRPLAIEMYAAGAVVSQGVFAGSDGRTQNELSGWTTVRPARLELAPRASGRASVTTVVPRGATGGERYAVVWAELPASQPQSGVRVVNRVGVRTYLSVGVAGAPEADFRIDTLTAARESDGRPVVIGGVTNTGERALDLRGELEMRDGPGGARAGPFPAESGTTVGIGQSAQVRVLLAPGLPAGPWSARLVLRSGLLERKATARLVFPEAPGSASDPVRAGGSGKGLRAAPFVVAVLVLLGLLVLVWWCVFARRRDRGDEERTTAEV